MGASEHPSFSHSVAGWLNLRQQRSRLLDFVVKMRDLLAAVNRDEGIMNA